MSVITRLTCNNPSMFSNTRSCIFVLENYPVVITLISFYRPIFLRRSTTSRATPGRLHSLLAACSRSMTSASSMPTGVLTVLLMHHSCQSLLAVLDWCTTNLPLMMKDSSGCVYRTTDNCLHSAYISHIRRTLIIYRRNIV